MQGVRESAVHKRQGHKRLTSIDKKPSCFPRNRRDAYEASLTRRLAKRCLNILPKIFHGFICLLAQSAIMNLEARLIREPLFPQHTSFTSFLLILRRRVRGGWNLISWVNAGEAAVFYCWWEVEVCVRGRWWGGTLAVQGYRCSKESCQHKHDKLCLSRLLTECWSGAIVAAVENPSGEAALQHWATSPTAPLPLHLDKAGDLTRDESSRSIFNHRSWQIANRRWMRHWWLNEN